MVLDVVLPDMERDALTGLRNRRFFDERLQEELRRAPRYGDHLSLIVIDLAS